MSQYVVLLKGINVGGHNIVKMMLLKEELSSLGFFDVKTYIQSGNIVLKSQHQIQEITTMISRLLAGKFNVQASVVVISAETYRKMIEEVPFDPAQTICYFQINDAIEPSEYQLATENWLVKNKIVYVQIVDKISNSAIISELDKKIKKHPHTARNMRTCQAILNLLEESN